MSISIIHHRGKEIVFVDYTQCKSPKETVALVEKSGEFLINYKGEALVLVNVTGAPGSSEYMAKAKEMSQKVNHKVRKRAVVGVVGLKKVLFQGFNRIVKGNNRAFDSQEEALEFLVA